MNCIDYNNLNGMNTRVWGPLLWTFLHSMSFNYPPRPNEKQKRDCKHFILSLKNILPCCSCRENFEKNMRAAKFSDNVFRSRNSFTRFIYRLHNAVNKMLGKPKYKTFEIVRNIYEQYRAKCTDPQRGKEGGCTISPRQFKCNITIK